MKLLLGCALVLLVCAAVAGQAPDVERPITLELRDAPVSDALALLFRSAGQNYVLESQSVAAVTVTLRDVPWRRAVQAVLDAAGLAYRQEDNVYHIVSKAPRPARPPVLEDARPITPTRPQLAAAQTQTVKRTAGKKLDLVRVRYADPADMAAMFGGWAVGGGMYGAGGSNLHGLGGYSSTGSGSLAGMSGYGDSRVFMSQGGYPAGQAGMAGVPGYGGANSGYANPYGNYGGSGNRPGYGGYGGGGFGGFGGWGGGGNYGGGMGY